MNGALGVLIRCDASPQLGLGHLVRCLALADELGATYGCRVSFAMREGSLGELMAYQRGYRVMSFAYGDAEADQQACLWEALTRSGARVLVVDVRDNLSRATLEALRNRGTCVVILDDSSPRRLAAHLAFYPPVPQVRRLEWDGSHTRVLVGWEWVILRPQFARGAPGSLEGRAGVLVTMGGSDPAGLTLLAVEALDRLEANVEVTIVVGQGFVHQQALEQRLATARQRYRVCRDVTNMADFMAGAELAVAAFGMTAYELAAVGTPAVLLSLTPDHVESAVAFVESGMAESLGLYQQVTPEQLAAAVADLLRDGQRRAQMSQRATQLVDGRGAARVAQMIVTTAGHG